MSVSSHLTPEPERRLWLILEGMQREARGAELKLGALAAFCALELIGAASAGKLGALTAAALGLTILAGLFGFAPLRRWPGFLDFLQPPKGRLTPEDCMIAVDDVAKYSHGELIHRLDRYLGGGITATQYYEDMVGQILVEARSAARKQRLLRLACAAAGIGQLLLLSGLGSGG